MICNSAMTACQSTSVNPQGLINSCPLSWNHLFETKRKKQNDNVKNNHYQYRYNYQNS